MINRKPKVMVMSDHSCLHTGFANVSRHILQYLEKCGKYEIAEFGWFAPNPEMVKDRIPQWKIYVTDRSTPVMADQDRYGRYSLEHAVADFQPDVLLSIGDEWMVNHVIPLKNKYGFYWISHLPIDGMPIPPEWVNTIKEMDFCVPYGKWGTSVIKQRIQSINPGYIYHGVDTNTYKPDKELRELTRKNMNISEDEFLIGYVGRNQPRKQIPSLFKAFSLFVKQHAECGKTKKYWITNKDEFYINEFIYPANEMPYLNASKADPKISPFSGKRDGNTHYPENNKIKLYLHCAFEDVGWNIEEQFHRYRLMNKVVSRSGMEAGLGVPENEMNGIYNAFDMFTLPTIGEGFGLPILEAMSCGIPLCVTNYSAHPEWCAEAGPLINPKIMYTEPLTNIERALVDINHYAHCIHEIYTASSFKRDKWSKNGIDQALKMDWETVILPTWEQLIYDFAYNQPKKELPKEEIMKMEIC